MQEVIKTCLKDEKELYKKYLNAERKYYKKLGNKYEEIKIDIDLKDDEMKKVFISLAKAGICFDDFITCLLKAEIVRKEYEKL